MNEQEEQTELSEDLAMISPGKMLNEARQNLGLSCQQVSDKLNFRVKLVQDIENDIFDKSLPATFNRGYLRNYAKLVKISADDVVRGFEALNIVELHGTELQSFSKETEKQAANNRLMWISYLILALLVGSTIMWWMQNKHIVSNNKQVSKETIQKSELKEAIESALSTVKNEANLIGAEPLAKVKESTLLEDNATKLPTTIHEIKQSTTIESVSNKSDEFINTLETYNSTSSEEINDSNSVSAETILTEQPLLTADNSSAQSDVPLDRILTPSELEDAPAPAYSESENIIQSQVSFTFSGDCWVNIYDNSGERIAWGIKRADYEMNILGQAPFTVTLGKPELVTIVFDGENIDMGQFRSGNIAKFTLPLTL